MQNRMNTVLQLTGSTLICTNGGSKTSQIESNNVDIYYGDSDSDMQYALAAQVKKVRPIRVLRSTMSENKPIPANSYNPGSFGEEIIVNSEN
jgi:acid phosphatase class B